MATEVAQMAEALRVEIEKLKGSMIAMEANHEQRLQLVEQEVLKMQRRPEYSGTSGRDKLITKKGFAALPKYSGKNEEYDDWRFQASTFLSTEDEYAELIEWIESKRKSPTTRSTRSGSWRRKGEMAQ